MSNTHIILFIILSICIFIGWILMFYGLKKQRMELSGIGLIIANICSVIMLWV